LWRSGGARRSGHWSNGLNAKRKRAGKTGQRAAWGSKIDKRKRNGTGRLETFGLKLLQEKEMSFSILNLL
jgi:hypothetical protein